MAHQEVSSDQNPQEQLFREYLLRGDDFFKIEIFRSARSWYEKALAIKTNEEKVKQKIAACNDQLAYEKKIFLILGIIAVVVIVALIVI